MISSKQYSILGGSRKHYWGSIQRGHCIQTRQLFLAVYNVEAVYIIKAAHKRISSKFHRIGPSASGLKLKSCSLSGNINFTSALFPIWDLCWIDREGWPASWQRPAGEMDILVDDTKTRWKRDASVGLKLETKEIFVGCQWKSWTLTRTDASLTFLSSKVSLDEGDDDSHHSKITRMSWDVGALRHVVIVTLGWYVVSQISTGEGWVKMQSVAARTAISAIT